MKLVCSVSPVVFLGSFRLNLLSLLSSVEWNTKRSLADFTERLKDKFVHETSDVYGIRSILKLFSNFLSVVDPSWRRFQLFDSSFAFKIFSVSL
jgi:hypothetical protein